MEDARTSARPALLDKRRGAGRSVYGPSSEPLGRPRSSWVALTPALLSPPAPAPGRLPSLGWFVRYGDTFKEVVLKSAPAGLGSSGGWRASWTRDVLQQ